MTENGTQEIFAGIDVSKAKLDVHILPSATHFTYANDPHGHEQLASKLAELRATLTVLEATGGYERDVVAVLVEHDVPAVVANARQVRDFAKAVGKLVKTDQVDAYCLALFAQKIRPEVRPVPTAETRELQDLLVRRRQLVTMRAAELVRRHEARARVKKSVSTMVDALSKEIDALDREIDDRINKSDIWRAKDDLLQSATGVGDVVARTLVAGLPELGHVSSKQIAALAGLAPFNNDSGQHRGKRHIRGGRYEIRMLLVLAARSAIRFDASMRSFYERLITAGKSKMVAIVAAARKLLVRLNAMARDNKRWDPVLVQA